MSVRGASGGLARGCRNLRRLSAGSFRRCAQPAATTINALFMAFLQRSRRPSPRGPPLLRPEIA
jgi:hypothetical protein